MKTLILALLLAFSSNATAQSDYQETDTDFDYSLCYEVRSLVQEEVDAQTISYIVNVCREAGFQINSYRYNKIKW